MNAFEKAMKAIEAAMARGKRPAPKNERVSHAERRKRISAGHKRRSAPVEYSVEEQAEYAEAQAPAPTPPDVEGPISAPLYAPPITPPRALTVPTSAPSVSLPHWAAAFERSGPPPATTAAAAPARAGRGSCKAIDADTGRTCKLLAHPENPDRHSSERGAFSRVLLPGSVPRLHLQLDAAATHQADVDGPAANISGAQRRFESRERLKAGIRLRKKKGSAA